MSCPHIIYLSDDHGWEYSGCYGHPVIQTPTLDDLADQGIHAFTASPTCTPPRSCLYSGLCPARNGAIGNHSACRPELKTFPAYLRQLGYRVAMSSEKHVRPDEIFDFEQVDGVLPPNPDHPRKYRAEGLDVFHIEPLLDSHDRDQPLCLISGDTNPHVTWEPNKVTIRQCFHCHHILSTHQLLVAPWPTTCRIPLPWITGLVGYWK